MKQWEYAVVDETQLHDPEVQLNSLGEKGWELVQVVHVPGWKALRYYLKREKPEDNSWREGPVE